MNKIFLPISIIVAGLIIAGAVFFTKDGANTSPTIANNESIEEIAIRPVSKDDHIFGNPDADIIIIEYSDFECPFCGRFHPTMEQIMKEFGKDGKVAWVYRHMPLDQIHKDARPASEASECVADLGGNDKFWEFSKIVFDGQPSSLKADALKEVALEIGIDEAGYDSCVSDRTFKDRVEADYQDGLLLAKNDPDFGTPYSLITTKDGMQIPVRGAQSFSAIADVLRGILGE